MSYSSLEPPARPGTAPGCARDQQTCAEFIPRSWSLIHTIHPLSHPSFTQYLWSTHTTTLTHTSKCYAHSPFRKRRQRILGNLAKVTASRGQAQGISDQKLLPSPFPTATTSFYIQQTAPLPTQGLDWTLRASKLSTPTLGSGKGHPFLPTGPPGEAPKDFCKSSKWPWE